MTAEPWYLCEEPERPALGAFLHPDTAAKVKPCCIRALSVLIHSGLLDPETVLKKSGRPWETIAEVLS